MKKYFFILLILTSAAGYSQAPNIIYGKDVIIQTRDTSSAELTIKNSTRNVLGYFKNIGGGKGQYTIIPQVDITGLPDSLLARYTKAQADARFKPISYVPDWLEITGKPAVLIAGNNLADVSNVATARDNLSVYSKSVVDDSLLNHYTKGQADGRFKGIGWLPVISDITGLPDSLTAVQGRIQTKQPLLGFTAVPDTRTVNGHALSADVTVTKSDVGLSNVPNTDATNAANISSGTLPDARLSSNVTTQGNNFNSANQLVKLDGGGKLPTSTIPSLALVETFVVSSQSAMLALSAQMGDVAVRTDNNKSYILQSEPATTLANWIELLVPSSEADPVYTASSWFSTTNNSGNWNTAYSWGNWAANSHYIGTTLIANNRGSGSQTLTGVSIDGNAATATSTSLLRNASAYPYSISATPTAIPYGVQNFFVGPATVEGSWQNYGSILSMRTYSGGGASFQMFVPYSPSFGGTGLQVRFGNYEVSGGDSWTSWKILLASDNFTDYTVTKTGVGASGSSWNIGILGNAATATTATNWSGSSSLGSYAYRSTGLAELSGATFTGALVGTSVSLSGAGSFGSLSVASGGAFFGGSALMGNGLYGIRNNDNTIGYGAFGRSGLIEGNSNTEIGIFSESGVNVYTGGSGTVKARFNPDGGFSAGNTGGITNKIGTVNFGFSGVGYPALGYNIRYTSTSNSYQYDNNDVSWQLAFGDFGKFRVRYAPSGTVGTTATYTDFLTIENTGTATFSSSVTSNSGSDIIKLTSIATNYATIQDKNAVNRIWFETTGGNRTIFDAASGGSFDFRDYSGTRWFYITSSNINVAITTASTSTSTGALIISGGLGVAGAINAGSDVVAYSTSDRRLKDNIRPIQNALYKLNQLTGNEFDWNNKQELYTGHDYGVIAQEVEKVLPNAITIRDNGYYGVKYDRIIPLLIEAVKELKAQVDQLKSN